LTEEEKKLKRAEYSKRYYEKNKIEICTKLLNQYTYNSIETMYALHRKDIISNLEKYPFEKYGEKIIKNQLRYMKISQTHISYDECYDAGMMAYLYSVYRCAVKSYENVVAYIKKLVRIFITCALNIYCDTKKICRQNGFSEVRLDNCSYRY